jgi:O-antigen/teichoic acid export membrane protein
VGVKLIFFVRLLILARLLVPEDFGLLAIAVSTIGIFLSLTDFGMIPALVQGERVEKKDYDTAWTVGLTRASAISLLVAVGAPLIAEIFAEPRATPIIQVLALRPILDSLVSIKIADLTRNLNFRPLSIIKLGEALANSIVSILLARTLGVWALVAGVLAGSSTNLILSYIFAPHRPRISFDRSSAQSLIRFGRWIFITSLIAMAGTNILRIIISRTLGTAELGLYFLAAQLAFMPAEIASEVVGSVTFPLFSRLQSNLVQLTRAFRASYVGMAALLFPVSALLIVLAPTFIQEVLGPEWEGTATILRIISLVTMIGLFGEAVVPVLKGVGRPDRVTWIVLVQYTILVLLAGELSARYGVNGAALAWLPAAIVSQVMGALYIRQILVKPFKALFAPLAAILTSVSVGAACAFLIDQYFSSSLFGFAIAIIGGLVVIGAILWVSERRFSLGFLEDLNLVYPKIATRLGLRFS